MHHHERTFRVRPKPTWSGMVSSCSWYRFMEELGSWAQKQPDFRNNVNVEDVQLRNSYNVQSVTKVWYELRTTSGVYPSHGTRARAISQRLALNEQLAIWGSFRNTVPGNDTWSDDSS